MPVNLAPSITLWYKVTMNRWMFRLGAIFAAAAMLSVALAVALDAVLAFGRPPQPLPWGTVQWLGEAGATVDGVQRTRTIGRGADEVRAAGEFYIVHARILAPFGMRPTWHDGDVEVDTFAYSGATRPPARYTVDERAQAVLDRMTGRPGPVHEVRGAEQHEDLVFDLPRGVEQPALVFLPANDPSGMLDILFGDFWQPHRFNLRYD